MEYNLVCIVPFHGYVKGQLITDRAEVTKLLKDRDHHFVKVPAVPLKSN